MVPIGLQIIYCFFISLASSFVIYADYRGRVVKYDGRIGMMKTTIRVGETEISRIGYGTLHLPVERGFGPARSNAVDLLKEARNLGIQFSVKSQDQNPLVFEKSKIIEKHRSLE